MAVNDYNVDPDLNTTISGINIAEGCPPSGINNAIRQLMADVKTESDELDGKIDNHVADAKTTIKADTVLAAQNAADVSGGSLGDADLNQILSAYEMTNTALAELAGGVVKSVNGVSADAAGNVADVSASGNGYIRFTNGLQICWGRSSCGASNNAKTVQLPAAFKDNTYGVTISYETQTPSTAISIGSTNTSSFVFYRNGTSGTGVFYYVAIGRWE